MTRKIASKPAVQFFVVLVCAFGLKWHYSTASVDQLRWVLWPTIKLVEFVTGARFTFESHAGYMNSEHTFLIAASCGGVNFLITAFVMLTLRSLWRERENKNRWRFILIAAAIAYAVTLVANTVRISLALQMLKKPFATGWLSASELHRLGGIFVYFGFLLLLFVFSEQFDRQAPRRDKRAAMLATLSCFWFPLMIYYGTTLGIPLVNGGYKQGSEFWQHAAFVVAVPLGLIAPLILARLVLPKTCGRGMPANCRQDVGAPTGSTSLRPRRGLTHPAMLSEKFD